MNTNAFHVYWSGKEGERNFDSTFILTALLSAISWKKYNTGKLTLYVDRYTMDFFEKNKLCDLWDVCDYKTLDQNIDKKKIDVNTFYTVGKFIALLNEPSPCEMIDIDLIIEKNISAELRKNRSMFTHYEKVVPRTIWYPKKEVIHKAPNYTFDTNWDFNTNALNTSFIYFNDDKLKNYYVECAINYITNNFIPSSDKKIGNPEVLFVEQRLLALCYNDFGVNNEVVPLIDIEWDPKKGKFNCKDKDGWPFFELDNDTKITHTWIAKPKIEENKLYKNYMCVREIEKILENRSDYYNTLKNIDSIKPYINLLDKYGSSENLIESNVGSNDLYGKKIIKRLSNNKY